jgi:hypothetical protein
MNWLSLSTSYSKSMAKWRASAVWEGAISNLVRSPTFTWIEQAKAQTPTDVEAQVLKFRKAMGERLAQTLADADGRS